MALKVISVVLKIVEIIVLLAATGVISYFVKEFRDDLTDGQDDDARDPYDAGVFGRYEFFLYTTCVGVIISVICLLALLTGASEKSGGALVMVTVHALCTLQLLVSTALVARVLAYHETERVTRDPSIKKSDCELWKDGFQSGFFDIEGEKYQCSQIIGGVACGFFATLLLVADTIVYAISLRSQ